VYDYDLHAVVVHQGGALGGHYISYVKVSNVWYYASDTSTRAATEAEVLKTEAYMLFYKQIGKTTKPPETFDNDVVEDVNNSVTNEMNDVTGDEGTFKPRASVSVSARESTPGVTVGGREKVDLR